MSMLFPPRPERRARRQQIRAEQVRILYQHAIVGCLVTLLNSAVVTYVLWPVVASATAIFWQGAILVVTLSRLALVWQYRRTALPITTLSQWRTRFILGAGAS